ncbi:MAG: DUF3592 domain-containing protein [Bdellovibrionales bacterium]|nr:DUF3592 domain-containing protein [Bdellovibrionales bacterium]
MKSGSGCLALFLLPFAAGGALGAYLLLSTIWKAVEAGSWTPVPARIVSTELTSHRIDDSTTYQVLAQYEYQVQVKTFTGERVTLHGGADNIGSFHQDAFQVLDRHRQSGEPFTAYVNPLDPSEAILYPSVRFGMLLLYGVFAATFGGVGIGGLVGVWYYRRAEQRRAALALRHPEQPWFHRADWLERKVKSDAGAKAAVLSVVAVVIGGITAPILFFVPEEVAAKGNYLALIALIFPVIAAGFLWFAARSVLSWRRFRGSTLELDRVPIRPGEKLRGALRLSANLPQTLEAVELTLKCERRVTRRSGGETEVSVLPVWSESWRQVPNQTGPFAAGSSVEVEREIPPSLPPTGEEEEGSEIMWKLEATASMAGPDLSVSFDLPVF